MTVTEKPKNKRNIKQPNIKPQNTSSETSNETRAAKNLKSTPDNNKTEEQPEDYYSKPHHSADYPPNVDSSDILDTARQYPSPAKSEPAQFEQVNNKALFNLPIEQTVLGTLLNNNNLFNFFEDKLNSSDFYDQLNKKIFKIISYFIQNNRPATIDTVLAFLANEKIYSELELQNYMLQVTSDTISIHQLPGYIDLIFQLSLRRKLSSLSIEIQSQINHISHEKSLDKIIEEISQKIFLISRAQEGKHNIYSFDEALTQSVDKIKRAHDNPDSLTGIHTTFKILDDTLGGLQNSDLIVIAGRPGMGKTSFATNIAFNSSNVFRKHQLKKNKQPNNQNPGAIVAFFSLEMSAEQLATRILSEQAKVSSQDLRHGKKINSQILNNIINIKEQIDRIPLFIDDNGGLKIATLMARARKYKKEHNISLIIIDYLQLIQSQSGSSFSNRVQEITEITNSLKTLAKELNIPIIALSQLSRTVESRDDKRPILSDLRDSGSIEQDADIVIFLYREYYYHKMKKPDETKEPERFEAWLEKASKIHDAAEVIIAKNRHGNTKNITMLFKEDYTLFSNKLQQ